MPESTHEGSVRDVGEDMPQASSTAALLRWFLVIGVVFAMIGLGIFWISRSLTASGPAVAEAPAPPGAAGGASDYPPPDFQLASLDGGTVGPPDFEGEAVVIDFWATWCGPCKIQAKMLDKLHEEYEGKGVRFLAINVGEEEETVRRYVEKTPFPYAVLLDPEEELSVRYQIYGLPTVMVINREGRISYLRTGLTDVPTLRRELERAGV